MIDALIGSNKIKNLESFKSRVKQNWLYIRNSKKYKKNIKNYLDTMLT
jgi:hypothetical protein